MRLSLEDFNKKNKELLKKVSTKFVTAIGLSPSPLHIDYSLIPRAMEW